MYHVFVVQIYSEVGEMSSGSIYRANNIVLNISK